MPTSNQAGETKIRNGLSLTSDPREGTSQPSSDQLSRTLRPTRSTTSQ